MNMNSPPKLTYEFPDLVRHDRLREFILYIAAKCADDPTFGATTLNKKLFFADFFSFRRYRRLITGVAYMRLSQGPAPRPMRPLCHDMQKREEIIIREVKLFQRKRHHIIPLREADLDRFTPHDNEMIDDVIREFCGRTAKDMSDLSHGRA
jgi:Protein of unknown function (DUF4065)